VALKFEFARERFDILKLFHFNAAKYELKPTIKILNKHIIVNTGFHLFDKTRESIFEPTQCI
jgi:hypothetical protein